MPLDSSTLRAELLPSKQADSDWRLLRLPGRSGSRPGVRSNAQTRPQRAAQESRERAAASRNVTRNVPRRLLGGKNIYIWLLRNLSVSFDN